MELNKIGSTVYNGKNTENWVMSERTLAHNPIFGPLSRQKRKNHKMKIEETHACRKVGEYHCSYKRPGEIKLK